MEDTEMITLWKSYGQKLDETLTLNRKNAEDITRIKVQSVLSSMRPLKIFAILVGIVWVTFVDILIINLYPVASPYFLISAGIQALLTKLAIGIYLYQLILIHQVDTSEPVLATQDRIARLKYSTIWIARVLFLQLPVWTTFYLSGSIFNNGNTLMHIIQIGTTALFTFAAVWLFLNIRYENRDKKWFKLIFRGNEWAPVMKSMELLDQINEYKEERK
jgi:hypothetical protein